MSNIVVADAGPLHYLVLIDCAEILPDLLIGFLCLLVFGMSWFIRGLRKKSKLG
jgi:hypothetical protein